MADNKQYITQVQENGTVMISEDVITTIVINSIEEVEGVAPVPTRNENASAGMSTTAADAVADEIAATLQALVGPADPVVPAAEPKHPTMESTTGKFANLQFGRNYDPTKR